jgi:hypothetical protein
MEDNRGSLENISDETLQKGDTRQDENVSIHDKGSEVESDKSDWRIEMADDVECDGIDDGLSDNNGGEPP